LSKQDLHIDELIAKSLAGEATAEENHLIDEWTLESDENKLALNEYKKLFEASNKHYKDTPTIDVNQEWGTFQQNINQIESSPVIPLTAASSRGTWYKMAAAFLLIIGSWYVINYYVNGPSIIEYSTADNIQNIELPDGTEVTLNNNTTFSYSKAYGKETRSVKLSGEAFFDVTPDKENPFVITTPYSLVKVLGTSFNVNSNESNSEVIVSTGIVEFLSTTSELGVILKAGDRAILDIESDQFETSNNEDMNHLAWKTRVLIFEANTLNSVVSAINRTYNSNISISEGIATECEVSVSFENQPLDEVLEILKSTLDLEYTTLPDEIIITKAGC